MKDILYPARRLHGIVHAYHVEARQKKAHRKELTHPKGEKAIVFGTPTHNNIGDSAIVLAEKSLLAGLYGDSRLIKEITVDEYNKCEKVFDSVLHFAYQPFWHGGGNMGDQWLREELFRRKCLEKQLKMNPLVFPQTIYYRDTEDGRQKGKESIDIYNDPSVTLVAREKTSYDIMRNLYPLANVLLTPDIVLSANMETFGVVEQERFGVLLCLRADPEKSVSDEVWANIEAALDQLKIAHSRTDMISDICVTKDNRGECVRGKMQEFCGAELVITDRLHGMVFAAITGTPCIVFSNYNHKVKGTYDWISYLPYIRYVETAEDAKKAIPELFEMKNCHFDNSPLMPYFNKLTEVIKEKCTK